MTKYFAPLFSLLLMGFFPSNGSAQQQPDHTASDIRMKLNKASTVCNVLYIAAHPDDENTRLISWLSNEKYVRTAYLSLTRGDGGQNLIGTEKGALMGLLRTQELLEARRLDGGEQYFTRAVDFGYSKNPEETFAFWDKQKILADVVWTIRKFKPDFIITRFPPTERAGHGHHTASAMLAAEAFDMAADPKAFPEQLKYVSVHQAKSLYHNTSTWWYKDLDKTAEGNDNYATADIGTYNPLLGMSYNELASESRSQHQSQGFGSERARGSQTEYLEFLKGEKAGKDLFGKTDLTWNRVKGGNAIAKQFEALIANFKDEAPWESMPALMAVHKAIAALPDNAFKAKKLSEVETIMVACSGIWIEVQADDYRYGYGKNVPVKYQLINRSPLNISIKDMRIGNQQVEIHKNTMRIHKLLEFEDTVVAPKKSTQPYWLTQPFEGVFSVDDTQMIGIPENKAAMNAQFTLDFDGFEMTLERPVVYTWTDRASGQHYSPISIVPWVTGHIDGQVLIFNTNTARTVDVQLTAHTAFAKGKVQLMAPDGWFVSETQAFNIERKGASERFKFEVTPPKKAANGRLKVKIIMEDGAVFYEDLIEINYDHIQRQTLIPPAESTILKMDIKTPGKRIGYIVGAGDDVPVSLEKIGYTVDLLDPAGLDTIHLDRYDCIITGIRAYNTQKPLEFQHQHLLEYVKRGGNLIVQYNTNRGLVTEDIGPYPMKLSRDRVTDETATATLLNPKHALLNHPNKITAADFDGWVQERGLYFADEWDDKYETVVSWHDGDEEARKGGILTADYGDGHFIYTGISFFRQLPAGVPGAYRLFANMIAYGRSGK